MRGNVAFCLVGAVFLTIAVCPMAFAGWVVVKLQPSGIQTSISYAVSSDKQAGYAKGSLTGSQWHAMLWSGTASSRLDINPANCTESCIYGAVTGKQVGYAYGTATANQYHASLWSGTAASWMDLNPAGYTESYAYGISGDKQVGQAKGTATGDQYHASLWSGTAASWVDLNPVGYDSSYAYGVCGDKQGGCVSGTPTQDELHASLWSGTAASRVDLNPAGCIESVVYAVSSDKQVGAASGTVTGDHRHASLWRGTAASWVNLNPGGCILSSAYGVSGDKQVGYAYGTATSEQYRASLWSGTAASWVDLHSLLTSNYNYSYARAVYTSGDEVWVVGYANNTNKGYLEAMMWHYVPPVTPPPGPVTSFAATGGPLQVSLSWQNPSDASFAGTKVLFKTSGFPTGPTEPTDGTLVCDKANTPGSNDGYVHTGLSEGVTYYYSAFAHDDAVPKNYSAATSTSGTPPDVTPPGPVTAFSVIVGNQRNNLLWTDPSDGDFAGTVIRCKTTGYPSSPADGMLVCDKANTPGSTSEYVHDRWVPGDQALTNGVTYYYSAFAHDEVWNYSARADASGAPVYLDPVEAKLAGDRANVVLTAGIVTARSTNDFYVQSEFAPVGIHVTMSEPGVGVGERVGVRGVVLTDSNEERYISADWAQSYESGSVAAYAMTNQSLGGGDWWYNDLTGAGQRGIVGASGVNNIGLLVTIWGAVVEFDDPENPDVWFRVDDGSKVNVKVVVPTGVAIDKNWQYVIVTGISSCEKSGDDLVRVIRVRKQDDIVPMITES